MPRLKNNNQPYRLKIGFNIRKWRELKGITPKELAGLLDISTAALSNIENDKGDLSLHRIEDIARCLNLDVMLLFKNPIDIILPPQRMSNNSLKVKAA